MIPPLVQWLALAEVPRDEGVITQLLERPPRSVAEHIAELPGNAATEESLPPLPLRRLVPTAGAPEPIRRLLDALTPEHLMPGGATRAGRVSLKAGLYLIHDELDAGHELAQQAGDMDRNGPGAYWHAVMHRREPDYDNARYWFRRVGRHPLFPRIGEQVARLFEDRELAARLDASRVLDAKGCWDPMAFISLCERCERKWNPAAQAAARLQEVEMRLLLEFTTAHAQP